jgi:hypothetical protein
MKSKALGFFAPWLVLAVIIGVSYGGILNFMKQVSQEEPDGYYELALARQTANHGLIRSIPQAEGLGWYKSYPEKAFLFTVIIGLAYKIGGEAGALAIIPILGILLLLSILWLVQPYCRNVWHGAFVMAVLLTTALFVNRIVLLRPHLLSMLAFVSILNGILNRRPWLAGIAGFIFSSGYHVSYIPLMVVAVAAAIDFRYGKKWTKSLGWTLGGLLMGLTLNPYFPENLWTEFTTIKIALNSGGAGALDRAVEMTPASMKQFILGYAFYLAILLLSMLELGGFLRPIKSKNRKSLAPKVLPKESDAVQLFLTLTTVLFFTLSAFNSRALEYAIPLGAVTFASLMYRLNYWKHAPLLLGVLALMFQAPMGIQLYKQKPSPSRDPAWLESAVKSIPLNGPKKVFNCEWWTTPALLYRRPDLRFIDISDPELLIEADRPASEMRNSLKAGIIAYPYGAIHNGFSSDYVLCESPMLVSQLEEDPNFKRLFPEKTLTRPPAGYPFVFEVRSKPVSNLVSDFEVAPKTGPTVPGKFPSQWTRVVFPEWRFLKPEQRSPYVDLFRWISWDAKTRRELAAEEEAQRCLWIRPTKEAIENFRGANWVGVGGGPTVRIWLNGNPLFYMPGKYHEFARMSHSYLPLPHALTGSDKIEALVCPRKEFDYLGFGMTLWKTEELKSICQEKGMPADKDNEKWAYWGETPGNCLGLTASRM